MAGIVLNPSSGNYGDTITITGTGFLPTTGITITYDAVALVTIPSSITTDGSGNFSATFVTPSKTLGVFEISTTDGTTTVNEDFTLLRKPFYCQVKDVADWIRIDINANTDPNTNMVKNYIMDNEDRIDRLTGHSWMEDKQTREVFTVSKLYDWGRGMPLFPRHRNMKEFDATKGDKFELWDGDSWDEQVVGQGNNGVVYFETVKGITYVRGYLFTILTESRFRVTYRYGGNNETNVGNTDLVPRDIQKACKLMTCLDILSTDFQMSQIPYGGEGNIDKQKVMDRWQKEIDQIIWTHSEIISTW